MLDRGLAARAHLYRRLGTLLRSGIGAREALDALGARGQGPGGLEHVRAALARGEDLPAALAGDPGRPPLEARLLAAGARGGALAEVALELAELLEQAVRARRELLLALAYPAVLVHLAVVLPSLAVLVGEGAGAYARAVLPPLALGWGALALGVVLLPAARAAAPASFDRLALGPPLLGGYLHQRALAHTLGALRTLYVSGVPIREALREAAEACPNAHLAGAFRRAHERVVEGAALGAALALEPDLPPDAVDLLDTGERSGTLDEALARARDAAREAATTRRRALVAVAAAGAFFLAAGVVAYRVITGYLSLLERAGAF